MEERRWNTARVIRKCDEKNVKKPIFKHEVEAEYSSETINSYNSTICKHTVVKTLTYTGSNHCIGPEGSRKLGLPDI
jgi:hypothetical protein